MELPNIKITSPYTSCSIYFRDYLRLMTDTDKSPCAQCPAMYFAHCAPILHNAASASVISSTCTTCLPNMSLHTLLRASLAQRDLYHEAAKQGLMLMAGMRLRGSNRILLRYLAIGHDSTCPTLNPLNP